jgi:hypothetical protein
VYLFLVGVIFAGCSSIAKTWTVSSFAGRILPLVRRVKVTRGEELLTDPVKYSSLTL